MIALNEPSQISPKVIVEGSLYESNLNASLSVFPVLLFKLGRDRAFETFMVYEGKQQHPSNSLLTMTHMS